MKRLMLFCFFLSAFMGSIAQAPLSLEEALREAVAHNYDIRLAKNESAIAGNNVTPGNAGFLPSLSFAGSGTLSSTNLNQKFASGLEVNRNGAGSKVIAAGIELDWTLFDGMKMFTTMDQLRQLDTLSRDALKVQIQNTCADVALAYFSALRYQQQARNTEKIIGLFEERKKIAESRLEIGTGSKWEVTQARVDLNSQRAALISQLSFCEQQKVILNRLMGRSPDMPFALPEETPSLYIPSLDNLRKKAPEQNQTLLMAERNISLQDLAWKSTRSGMYPRIALNAGTNLGLTRNEAGFLLSNQSLGFSAGLSASWTLFNGFNQQRLSQNAELSLVGARLNYESERQVIDAEIMVAWKALERARELSALEKETFQLATENADIVLESFRLGKISGIEMKAAQESLANTANRMAEAEYQSRVAETALLKLTGEWMK